MIEIEATFARGGVAVLMSRLINFLQALERFLGQGCTSAEVHRWYLQPLISSSLVTSLQWVMRRTEVEVDKSLLPSNAAQFSWVPNEVLAVSSVYCAQGDFGDLHMLLDNKAESGEWSL